MQDTIEHTQRNIGDTMKSVRRIAKNQKEMTCELVVSQSK